MLTLVEVFGAVFLIWCGNFGSSAWKLNIPLLGVPQVKEEVIWTEIFCFHKNFLLTFMVPIGDLIFKHLNSVFLC